MRRLVLVFAAVAMAVALCACAGSQPSAGSGAAGDSAAEVTSAAPKGSSPKIQAAEKPAAPKPKPAPSPNRPHLTRGVVTRVVDGDTAHIRLASGKVEKVRFIGIDTPEDTKQVDPFGPQATAFARKKLDGRTVWLEQDAEARDRYGRLLAYVWLAEPTRYDSDGLASDVSVRRNMYNGQVALAGYAMQMTIAPNVKYAQYFRTYVAEARRANCGLWAGGSGGAQAPPAATPAPSTAAYVGNRNTLKFHRPDCSSVQQMNPGNRVALKSRAAAIDAGYVPCKNCRP